MKPVKYFLLARGVKILLQFALVLLGAVFCFNLYLRLSGQPNIKIGDGTVGHSTIGYDVRARMTLNIPDSMTYYKNGSYSTIRAGRDDFEKRKLRKDTVMLRIANQFRVYENRKVSVSNEIFVPENVNIRVVSENKSHNLFWAVTEYIGFVFYGISLVILIKLVNRYLDREIFEIRSFALISMFGVLLILNELIDFAVNMINMLIFQHPTLQTNIMVADKAYPLSYINIHPAQISFTNLVIGLLIIFLAQIIKEAIKTKEEQELTI